MPAPYRIGIDIGTNSLGWCLVGLNDDGEPGSVLDIGVRIFKDARDPKSRASLAATRRQARAMRRQRDRRLGRKHHLMVALVRHGLMPVGRAERKRLEVIDPYRLRAEGLDRPLTPYELGRALFHINQRRGFQSNLKTDRATKSGVTREAQKRLVEALDGHQTLGQFLYRRGVGVAERHFDDRSLGQQRLVRFRPHIKGARVEYDLYPTRAMYRAEFDALWNAQRGFGLPLSDEARTEIRDGIVFDQRKLKPVPVGKCTFDRDDSRAPQALPIAERFRILQELNNLEWIDRERRGHRLDANQRKAILGLLERQKTVSFDKMRTKLGLGTEVKFNLESAKRTKLDGDKVGHDMASKKYFGERWWRMSLDERNDIVERILGEEDEAAFMAVATAEWNLTPEQAEAIMDMSLPDRHYRLGRVAIRKLLPLLESGQRYFEAATAVYGDHALLPTGEVFDELPYYGRRLVNYTAVVPSASDPDEREYGRLANPTVHVALNQLRRVVNEIIVRYGRPAEIVVELARELPLGKEDLRERESEQKANQERNEKQRIEIESLLRDAGSTEAEIATALRRGDALLRMRLWKELGPAPDHRCPYTLEKIGIRRLFSDEVHIDHILPFRRTHDDGYANKLVCLRRANTIKSNRTPWEAFHDRPAGYDWDGILLRSTGLPENKRWRFAEDAMQRFSRLDREGVPRELADQFGGQDSFLARHLIDTQYIARVTREYLTAVCDPRKVWPITGATTAMLRGKWGLNSVLPGHNVRGGDGEERRGKKNRLDHRHHAVDAFVVACTSRSMLQRIATAADDERDRLIDDMPEPWDGYREELRDAIGHIVVSFRPDHGSTGTDPRTGRSRTSGALHNDTAYFPLAVPEKDGRSLVVSRKPIAGFESLDDVAAVTDVPLRDALRKHVEVEIAGETKIKDAFASFVATTGIRKVRVQERMKVIPVRDRFGRPFKAYKGDSNDCMEVWRLPDGKWVGHVVSTFEANSARDGQRYRPHPAAKLLMTLYVDDLVRLVDGGTERSMRIVKLSEGKVAFADHFESGNLKDRDDLTRKALRARRDGLLIGDRSPDEVLAESGEFSYLTKSPSTLRNLSFRKLNVTPAGQIFDPGPPS